MSDAALIVCWHVPVSFSPAAHATAHGLQDETLVLYAKPDAHRQLQLFTATCVAFPGGAAHAVHSRLLLLENASAVYVESHTVGSAPTPHAQGRHVPSEHSPDVQFPPAPKLYWPDGH